MPQLLREAGLLLRRLLTKGVIEAFSGIGLREEGGYEFTKEGFVSRSR